MAILVDDCAEEVPGVSTANWKQDPRLCLDMSHGEPRPSVVWIHAIVLHTTKGIPGGKDHREQQLLPGLGPDQRNCEQLVDCWANDNSCASAHLFVDFNGTAACLADLSSRITYHAAQHDVNRASIGIEIYQGVNAELYEGQLDCVVRLVDYLTRRFGVQRQFQRIYHKRPVKRITEGGRNVVGIYGHRDVTDNRGQGDPGDYIFQKLAAAGYEAFDFEADEDLAAWKKRQTDLNAQYKAGLQVDGIPGQKTRDALRQAGRPHGLWISRPGD